MQAVPLAAVNGAIESLGKGLAREFAPLRVNVVSPGGIGTARYGEHDGRPDDVAALVIATLANPWITERCSTSKADQQPAAVVSRCRSAQ